MPGEQRDAASLPPSHDPIAVVLNLVNPHRAAGRLRAGSGKAREDEAKREGTRRLHYAWGRLRAPGGSGVRRSRFWVCPDVPAVCPLGQRDGAKEKTQPLRATGALLAKPVRTAMNRPSLLIRGTVNVSFPVDPCRPEASLHSETHRLLPCRLRFIGQ